MYRKPRPAPRRSAGVGRGARMQVGFGYRCTPLRRRAAAVPGGKTRTLPPDQLASMARRLCMPQQGPGAVSSPIFLQHFIKRLHTTCLT